MKEVRITQQQILAAPPGISSLEVLLVGTGILTEPHKWERTNDFATGDIVFRKVRE